MPAPTTPAPRLKLHHLPTEILLCIVAHLLPDDTAALACTIPRLTNAARRAGALARFSLHDEKWSTLDYKSNPSTAHPPVTTGECVYARVMQDLTRLAEGGAKGKGKERHQEEDEGWLWYYPVELLLQEQCHDHVRDRHGGEEEIRELAEHSQLYSVAEREAEEFLGCKSNSDAADGEWLLDVSVSLALELLPNLRQLKIPCSTYFVTRRVLPRLAMEGPRTPRFLVPPLQYLCRVELTRDRRTVTGLDPVATFLLLPALEHLRVSGLVARAGQTIWPALARGRKLRGLVFDQCRITCRAFVELFSRIPALQSLEYTQYARIEHDGEFDSSYGEGLGMDSFRQVLLTYTQDTLEHLDLGYPAYLSSREFKSLQKFTRLRTIKLPKKCLPRTTPKTDARSGSDSHAACRSRYAWKHREFLKLSEWLPPSIESATVMDWGLEWRNWKNDFVLPLSKTRQLLDQPIDLTRSLLPRLRRVSLCNGVSECLHVVYRLPHEMPPDARHVWCLVGQILDALPPESKDDNLLQECPYATMPEKTSFFSGCVLKFWST